MTLALFMEGYHEDQKLTLPRTRTLTLTLILTPTSALFMNGYLEGHFSTQLAHIFVKRTIEHISRQVALLLKG